MEAMQLPNGLTVSQVNVDETEFLYHEIFTERCYLRNEITLAPGDTVLDVGANIGLTTLFLHTEFPGLTFYCFEPAPVPYAALSDNIAAHKINATAVRCALSDHSGVGDLTYYPHCTAMSGFHPDLAEEAALGRSVLLNSGFANEVVDAIEATRNEAETLRTVQCSVRTLSEVITEQRITSVDLLKVDVQKSELEVLGGLAEADWPKIRQCIAEVHDVNGGLRSFTSLLAEHGFSVTVQQDALFDGTEIYMVFAWRNAA
ncbi:FkbM family methyltransferase [Streptomyces stramineus]|uniref:Methyltransferase FkbM domain-containing protein n=1 Tax=Streptomyces stramineus TaxID=173861 RepID=A0ABP3KPX9_9ACTN